MTEIIEDRLNLREGAKILEKDSLEEAALWCFQHDVFPIGLWLGRQDDDEYSKRLAVSKPILEDYLDLIFKDHNDTLEISRDKLFKKMASYVATLDRYPDGDITASGADTYYRRFNSGSDLEIFNKYELSVYNYRKIEIEGFDFFESPVDNIGDKRSEYVANLFKEYFPRTASFSGAIAYPSRADSGYINHVDSLVLAVRSFLFRNEICAPAKSGKVDDAIQMLATWTVMIIGPKVEGEGI